MPQTINVPGVGQLQFPDGMSQPEMAAAIQKNFPSIHTPAAPISDGKAQGQRIMSVIDQANSENGKAILGVGETALNAATGIGSSIVGGFRGLASLATGGSLDDARNAIEDTQHDYTYQPRTGVGKLGSELLTVPVMAVKSAGTEIGGDVGQFVGGAKGRAIGESVGNIAPDIAATLAGGRAAFRGRSPVADLPPSRVAPVTVAIDYDVPSYVMNPKASLPVPALPLSEAAPVIRSPLDSYSKNHVVSPYGELKEALVPTAELNTALDKYSSSRTGANEPQELQLARDVVPTIPASSTPILSSIESPIEAYARQPIASPFGALNEAIVPAADAATGLDAYAARSGEPAQRQAPLNQFDDILREADSQSAPRSPLDSMIAGDDTGAPPAVRAITAGLRDTSDIDTMLQNFGVSASEPISAPVQPRAIPSESVELASGSATPLDASMQIPAEIPPLPPSRVPGTYQSAVVEQAKPSPVVPLDDAMRVPEASTAADTPFVATPEQHVNPALRDQNLQTLRDVGLENIRESAVIGDAATSAREYQHGKITSEPAGLHWFDQFQGETAAMKNYAQQLVDETKGRTGLDEASMTRKGMDIAAPYDAAREYFEKAKDALYKEADAAAGGLPSVRLDGLAKLLDTDSVFEGRAEKSALRKGVRAYLREQSIVDADGNMQPITAKTAEGLRKYLNGEWSPQNAGLIGKIKAMLDDDVYASAGEGSDVYAAGRRMHQLEKQTLDNPNGIAKIMDSDPYTPVNRNTDFHKMPDKIMTLSEDQFKHIIDTYRQLPPELQPLAQRAIATLKAHYAEKLVDTGVESGRGNPRQLWNAGGVKTLVKDNSAKLPLLFDASEMKRIQTLLDAGEILRVNPAYPGAAGQFANAYKAGMMSNLLGRSGGGIGGMVGAFTGGPAGAAVGGIAGEAAASSILRNSAERKALAAAKEAIISEHRQVPSSRTTVDEWEAGNR